MIQTYTTATSSGTINSAFNVTFIDASAGNMSLVLPTPAADGQSVQLARIDQTANTVGLVPSGTDTVNATSSLSVSIGQALHLIYNLGQTDWMVGDLEATSPRGVSSLSWPVGATGATGDAGPTGATGATGSAGATGATGGSINAVDPEVLFSSGGIATGSLGFQYVAPNLSVPADGTYNIGSTLVLGSQSANSNIFLSTSGTAAPANGGARAIAIGATGAGQSTQGADAVAIGSAAGQWSQGSFAVAVGASAGQSTQASQAVAIGRNAGVMSQGAVCVAVGTNAGQTSQSPGGVAVGYAAGQRSQQGNSVAVGPNAGQTSQAASSVAIGWNAAADFQGSGCVAVGLQAAGEYQGGSAVAVGSSAGLFTQGTQSVAIGNLAATSSQGSQCVAIGYQSAYTAQGIKAVAIGYQAALTSQGANAVAIGSNSVVLGADSIAIGHSATCSTFTGAIALGLSAAATANNQCMIAGQLNNGGTRFPTSTGVANQRLGLSAAGTAAWMSPILNASTASQSPSANSTAALTGSTLSVPASGLQAGTIITWSVCLSKTAAGTQATQFLFKLGTTGTTADPTILTFTTGAGTAVADSGTATFCVTIRGPLGASCIAQGNMALMHSAGAAGFSTTVVPISSATSGTFTSSTANLIASLAIVTGVSTAITVTQVVANMDGV